MLIKSHITSFLKERRKNETIFEPEEGVAYVRIHKSGIGATHDHDNVVQIDIILDEGDDWDRTYVVECRLGSTVGFHGNDGKGVKVSCNFVDYTTIMGTWDEDNSVVPFIIDMRPEG